MCTTQAFLRIQEEYLLGYRKPNFDIIVAIPAFASTLPTAQVEQHVYGIGIPDCLLLLCACTAIQETHRRASSEQSHGTPWCIPCLHAQDGTISALICTTVLIRDMYCLHTILKVTLVGTWPGLQDLPRDISKDRRPVRPNNHNRKQTCTLTAGPRFDV